MSKTKDLISQILAEACPIRFTGQEVVFLINENVENYVFNRPFVDKRMKISEFFLSDIMDGIDLFVSDCYKNLIHNLNELISKKPVFWFKCAKSSQYLKLTNQKSLDIFCRIIFKQDNSYSGYFGDTQIVNQNGKDFILVTVYEANFIDQSLFNENILIDDYVKSLKKRFQPNYVYSSNFVHEFQHAMQMIHNLNSGDKYDLDGDLQKINSGVYYSVTTEKEAFYIQIMKFLDQNGLLVTSDYKIIKPKFSQVLNLLQLPTGLEKVFLPMLQEYCNQGIKENMKDVSDKRLIDILKKSGSKDPEAALKRSKELDKLSKEDFKNSFINLMKNGVKTGNIITKELKV